MARELHTLNDNEMAMVNEYVEMGIADTHETALKYLLESGMIQDRVSTKGVYIPEGYAYLKFHNGHQKSKFTQVDKLSKKAKKESPFELENWYIGSEFPKDDSGNIILDEVISGESVGQNPEIIITHLLYSASRFNPQKPAEAIETTLANNMSIDSQKQMIDLKSKKSLYEIRQEQLKTFGVEKYSDVDKDERVKFKINVFGLIKTATGWKKAWLQDTVGKLEYRLEVDFLEEVIKVRKKHMFNFITTLTTEEDTTNAGSYIRKLVIKEEIDSDTRKEITPLVGECNRAISKFLADQKDNVSNTSNNSGSVHKLDPEEEDLDESIFE